MDKFRTCARTRPYENQTLGTEFFVREHSKPLFNKHQIMTIHNLYYYHCTTDIFKIMKFRNPISLFNLFNLSKRLGKDTLLVTPYKIDSYICRAGIIWNSVRQKLGIKDFSHKFGPLKSSLKKHILNGQATGNPEEWESSNQIGDS